MGFSPRCLLFTFPVLFVLSAHHHLLSRVEVLLLFEGFGYRPTD